MSNFDPTISSEELTDPGLSLLKEQIKNVMIPLLIKVFQLRLEIQQAASPPSRLNPQKSPIHLPDLIEQLEILDENLKLLQIWNQSCRTQIDKVLLEARNECPPSLNSSIKTKQDLDPAVQKSFQEALSSQLDPHKKLKTVQVSPQKSSALQTLIKNLTLLYRKTLS